MTKQTAHGARIRPILFSTAMVQAILEGRKTQTRRVVKPQSAILTDRMARSLGVQPPAQENPASIPCPYGQPGDILWVRETWGYYADTWGDANYFEYKGSFTGINDDVIVSEPKWKPSIHMPFESARIFLRIKAVRVERLQDISTEDCLSEGLSTTLREHDAVVHLSQQWEQLWQSINGPESWDANPWVWVLEFQRVSREEAGL